MAHNLHNAGRFPPLDGCLLCTRYIRACPIHTQTAADGHTLRRVHCRCRPHPRSTSPHCMGLSFGDTTCPRLSHLWLVCGISNQSNRSHGACNRSPGWCPSTLPLLDTRRTRPSTSEFAGVLTSACCETVPVSLRPRGTGIPAATISSCPGALGRPQFHSKRCPIGPSPNIQQQ
jgi:hypothetical protein